MNPKSINQLDALFQSIATAHWNINDYFFGPVTSMEEKWDKNAKYPVLCVIPTQTVVGEQVKDRSFQVMVFDISSKDKTDTTEVLSDTELILEDVLKILKNESNDYELVGEPILIPEDETHLDWVTGYRAEIVLRTGANNNYCDIPADDLGSSDPPPFAVVRDQNGNVLMYLYSGDTYDVIVASGIVDDLNATVTVIDQL